MEKISKIVQSRLARGTVETSASHPDANLLAAFAENTLMKRERAAVLAHLAQCADCRDSVALASKCGETESAAVVGSATRPPVRRVSPVWRWVSGAAVALCVTAVVWQLRMDLPTGAQAQKSSHATTPAKEVSPAPSAISETQPQIARDQVSTVTQPKLARRFNKPAKKESQSTEKQTGSQVNSPLAMRSGSPLLAPAAPGLDLQSSGAFSGGHSRQRARREATAMPANQPFRVLPSQLALKSVAEPNILWSINASPATASKTHGVVQQSADGGETWEAVPISDDVDFRAVAAEGLDVWAGGADGALFHSSDGGLHWTQIEAVEGNAKLRGTIVSIDTRKSPQIVVSSNLGEKWISMDGGMHWQRE